MLIPQSLQHGHATFRRQLSGLFLLFSAAVLVSCTSYEATPDSRAVDQVFRPFYATQPEANSTADLDIYVDGSMSMRGYASAPESNYTRVLREILQSATAAQFNLNIYKFTSAITAVTHMPLSQLQSPGFYDGRDTPLASLLNRLLDSPTHSVIIISDLVQSEGGVDSLALVKALSQLANHRPQMQLLGYRSGFIGDYYPENRAAGQRTIRLNLSQNLPGTGRPFYLLVVAPNVESMKRVEDYLLSRFPAVQTFNPMGLPMVMEHVDLMSDDAKRESWSLYARVARSETVSGVRMESAFLFTGKQSESTVPLPLVFRFHQTLPVREASRLNWEVTKATWKQGGFSQPAQSTIPITGTLRNDDQGARMELQLTLQKPDPNTWDAYHVKMRAGDANLNMPKWVADWNTENDAIAENANRTFQLELLVEAMMNAISEKVVFCEYVLKIGRKN